jgi:hypothetical protein
VTRDLRHAGTDQPGGPAALASRRRMTVTVKTVTAAANHDAVTALKTWPY